MNDPLTRRAILFLVPFALAGIVAIATGHAEEAAAAGPQATQAQPQAAVPAPEAPNELFVTVGKSILVNSGAPIERVSVGYGDVAEATPVGPREVLVNGKAPGETSLIIWQQGGGKLFFDVTVRPSTLRTEERVDTVRRELKKELPDQSINLSYENDTVFLRGRVKDLVSAERAVAISATLGKTVNLLYVEVPETEEQVLLKVQFASVDRSVTTDLGMNLISTGATNTIGAISTGQFPSATLNLQQPDPTRRLTLSDALNIFMFRPGLNLAASIKALQNKGLVEVLAEPNVLAINGKQGSFVAGGEFPYPILQGGGAGLGAVTIAFRQFGIIINFLPLVTPRGTIKLQVEPEVSSLDFANGLVFQGFTIPAITERRVHTEIELNSGQAFAIGGLLDRRLTETLEKIPLLADIPLLGKLFRSQHLQKNNNELLVIVTPERVRPIPEGQKPPSLDMPAPLWGPDQMPRTPGVQITGPVPPPAGPAIPVEQLREAMKAADAMTLQPQGSSSVSGRSFQQQSELPAPGAPIAPLAPPMPVAPPK